MKKIYRKMMVLMNRKQKLKMIQILFMMGDRRDYWKPSASVLWYRRFR